MTDWFSISNPMALFPIYNVDSGIKEEHLIRLETTNREVFIRKKHLTTIEKAYDTTWKYGIMRDLRDLSLKGRLPRFINGFLLERKFKILIGSTLSDIKNHEERGSQGSVLSVILFSIKINYKPKCLYPEVNGSLYVVDLLICHRSKKYSP